MSAHFSKGDCPPCILAYQVSGTTLGAVQPDTEVNSHITSEHFPYYNSSSMKCNFMKPHTDPLDDDNSCYYYYYYYILQKIKHYLNKRSVYQITICSKYLTYVKIQFLYHELVFNIQ
jgi:hypothetical protein